MPEQLLGPPAGARIFLLSSDGEIGDVKQQIEQLIYDSMYCREQIAGLKLEFCEMKKQLSAKKTPDGFVVVLGACLCVLLSFCLACFWK